MLHAPTPQKQAERMFLTPLHASAEPRWPSITPSFESFRRVRTLLVSLWDRSGHECFLRIMDLKDFTALL